MCKFTRYSGNWYDRVAYNIHGRITVLEEYMNISLPEKLANLATRAEINEVEKNLRGEIKEVNTRIEAVNTTLCGEINEVEKNLRGEINEVNIKIEVVKGELHAVIQKEQKENRAWLLKTAGGLFLGMIGLMTGLFFSFQVRMDRLEDRLEQRMDQRFGELKELIVQLRPSPSSRDENPVSP